MWSLYYVKKCQWKNHRLNKVKILFPWSSNLYLLFCFQLWNEVHGKGYARMSHQKVPRCIGKRRSESKFLQYIFIYSKVMPHFINFSFWFLNHDSTKLLFPELFFCFIKYCFLKRNELLNFYNFGMYISQSLVIITATEVFLANMDIIDVQLSHFEFLEW